MPYFIQRVSAAILLVLLSPVLGLVGLLVCVRDGRPVMFEQNRLGEGRKEFRMWKFRTMVNDADHLLLEDPTANRLTKTGPLLRATGVDELPQLWNIVKGDMAGIGPRAMLPEVARNIPSEFEQRFEVKPGLTGLAQVRGRNDLLWSERLAADVEYVKTRSLLGDLKITLLTFAVIFQGTGFQMDRNAQAVDDLGLIVKGKR